MPKKVTIPTVANGDWITPGWVNTNIKQNMEALWPFTTNGDLVRASAADELVRIPPGISGQVLTMSSGVPTWAAPPEVIHAKGVISTVGTTQNTNSSSFVDLTDASINMTINRLCTIVVFGNAVGYAGSGGGSYPVDFNLLIDGTSFGIFQTFTPYPGAVCMVGHKSSVGVGTRVVKARFRSPFGITVYSYGVYLNVFAFPEY